MSSGGRYEGVILIEPTSRGSANIMKIKRVLVMKKTKYQDVILAELEDYGRALIIDNYVQSSEVDEYIYHESLVHPAMITHPNPRRVLIIGGGEGATLREVLKHNMVEEAVMVDIDEEVVEFSKKYLDFMHQGSFDDPRSKLVIMDGRVFLEEASPKSFDVIIFDLTDPYSSELSRQLYSREFYEKAYRVLRDDGIMVTQAGNSFYYYETYEWVLSNVSTVYPIVVEYMVWVPVFGYSCNFIIGSKKYDPKSISEEEIARRLKERGVKTRFYSSSTHIGLIKTPIIKFKTK
ncbi:MAG: polyamine aminopropyltransferase [Desulfurococcales archaeon]|nr:polyamine aminopropyltransferase [Desulfurococcales archaeon]